MKLNPPPPFAVFGCKVKGKKEAENLFFVAEVCLVRHLQGCRFGCARIPPAPDTKERRFGTSRRVNRQAHMKSGLSLCQLSQK